MLYKVLLVARQAYITVKEFEQICFGFWQTHYLKWHISDCGVPDVVPNLFSIVGSLTGW